VANIQSRMKVKQAQLIFDAFEQEASQQYANIIKLVRGGSADEFELNILDMI